MNDERYDVASQELLFEMCIAVDTNPTALPFLRRVEARYYELTASSLWAPYAARCRARCDAGFVVGSLRCSLEAGHQEGHVF